MVLVMVSATARTTRQRKACLFVTPDPSDPGLFVVNADDAVTDASIPVIPTLKAHRYWTVGLAPPADSEDDHAEMDRALHRHPSTTHTTTRE
jgi:hypothetical protein